LTERPSENLKNKIVGEEKMFGGAERNPLTFEVLRLGPLDFAGGI